MERRCVPLISRATAAELNRVLSYSKFRLASQQLLELHAFYLPYCQQIDKIEACEILCRDAKDQMFLDLAHSGHADILVTGDQDLLVLAADTSFVIETPEAYRLRLHGPERTP
jgi:putative PIN family toxin of toxin-antitoxin system